MQWNTRDWIIGPSLTGSIPFVHKQTVFFKSFTSQEHCRHGNVDEHTRESGRLLAHVVSKVHVSSKLNISPHVIHTGPYRMYTPNNLHIYRYMQIHTPMTSVYNCNRPTLYIGKFHFHYSGIELFTNKLVQSHPRMY